MELKLKYSRERGNRDSDRTPNELRQTRSACPVRIYVECGALEDTAQLADI